MTFGVVDLQGVAHTQVSAPAGQLPMGSAASMRLPARLRSLRRRPGACLSRPLEPLLPCLTAGAHVPRAFQSMQALGPGDLAVAPLGMVHYLANEGCEPASYVVVFTSGGRCLQPAQPHLWGLHAPASSASGASQPLGCVQAQPPGRVRAVLLGCGGCLCTPSRVPLPACVLRQQVAGPHDGASQRAKRVA